MSECKHEEFVRIYGAYYVSGLTKSIEICKEACAKCGKTHGEIKAEQERAAALEMVAGLTKERDDYVEGLREIELGGQPADNIARWTLEEWGKSTQ